MHGKCLSMARNVCRSFSADSRLNWGLRPKLDTETDGPVEGGEDTEEWGPLPESLRPSIRSMGSMSDSEGKISSK